MASITDRYAIVGVGESDRSKNDHDEEKNDHAPAAESEKKFSSIAGAVCHVELLMNHADNVIDLALKEKYASLFVTDQLLMKPCFRAWVGTSTHPPKAATCVSPHSKAPTQPCSTRSLVTTRDCSVSECRRGCR